LKTILILTIGTSDVQVEASLLQPSGFALHPEDITKEEKRIVNSLLTPEVFHVKNNRNNQDSFLICRPREDGIIMLRNYQYIKSILSFPLIEPVLLKLVINNNPPNKILLIYTDQPEPPVTSERHFQNDTLFFKDLLELRIRELLPGLKPNDIISYKISDHITDIDFHYSNFEKETANFMPVEDDELKQVFLLAQGGIDQINQAVTLQLIRRYGNKLKLYQKAEEGEPVLLRFPRLFLNDLNKEKINKHLEDYDFGLIADLTFNKKVKLISEYAYYRLSLKYDELNPIVNKLKKETDHEIYQRLVFNHNDNREYLRDIYLQAKINLLQKQFADFLWRVFTFSENLFKSLLYQQIGSVDEFYQKKNISPNQPWLDYLTKLDNRLPGYLEKKHVNLANPNRKTFFYIFKFFIENKGNPLKIPNNDLILYNTVFRKLEDLSGERNNIAHYLRPASISQIEKILNQSTPQNYNISKLQADIDQILEIETFGIYDKIRHFIRSEIGGI